MKSVMISIKPRWCELIASGRKTIEVRKSKPNLETPFKCYIYCTKADQRLIDILKDGDENYGEIYHGKPVFIKVEKGSVCDMYGKRQKVIGEFVCDEILQFNHDDYNSPAYDISDDDLNRTCLFQEDLYRYANGKTLYGWHISDLVIYDVPRELSEFVVNDKMAIKTCRHRIRWGQPESVTPHGGWIKGGYCCTRYSEPVSCEPVFCENYITKPVSRPPQSWCYVEEEEK